MRPDVNDYHSSHSATSTRLRIQTCIEETIGIDDPAKPFKNFDMYIFVDLSFDIFAVELEFIYDVVYTKVVLIYTKLGCSLRIISFISSFSVVLLFFISIINEPKFHFSRVDIAITGILLTGAVALELYAAWVMLSSNWAIFVAAFHHNLLVRKIFSVALKRLPWLLHRGKSWSNKIGQFDLLRYCLLYKKKKGNQSSGILHKITNNDITDMWHKYMFTKFDPVPRYLMDIGNFLHPAWSFIRSDSFRASRGENALSAEQYDDLRWSIKLDFDYSIIIWHLATSVCYYQEHQGDDDNDDEAKISKQVSDYMMYLLAMCPALILPEQSKSFWLDHAYDKLKELLFSATETTNATSTLLSNPDIVDEKEHESSEESTMENLQGGVSAAIDIRNVVSRETTLKQILKKDVFKLATFLKQLENKWKLIREVWIEMLVYAAVSSQNISHVVFLHCPPGTGKTPLVRLCIQDAGANLFRVNGPEIVSQYWGASEQALREVFDSATKAAPSVLRFLLSKIFIHELDAIIAPARKDGGEELSQRMVATLVELMAYL
ncbi:hypothetical protein SLEP1_g54893 [Rubroshorea leprosula]|uniref:DUF4220 domain-containing protein n=1 Tax=Rubroshorea leprosula TaxID=152421 RepID=A0AAV5MEX6_9ROSI|nr:hypothetical protein SLEP1_g54893 [Rubroshorea leprosula]